MPYNHLSTPKFLNVLKKCLMHREVVEDEAVNLGLAILIDYARQLLDRGHNVPGLVILRGIVECFRSMLQSTGGKIPNELLIVSLHIAIKMIEGAIKLQTPAAWTRVLSEN